VRGGFYDLYTTSLLSFPLPGPSMYYIIRKRDFLSLRYCLYVADEWNEKEIGNRNVSF
jgi:hypothetical protein